MSLTVEPTDPLPLVPDAEAFSVPVGDVTLGGYAWWQAAPARTIVMVHGWGQDATTLAPQARRLHAEGWSVVSLAARGWPGSTGDPNDYGLSAELDVPAVTDAVRQRGADELWWLGYSAGGLATARGVPAADGIAGLVTVNSPMNLHTEYRDARAQRMRDYYDTALTDEHWARSSPVLVADRIDVPMLLIAGSDDAMIPPSQAREMAALVPDATHIEVPGMRHLPSPQQWDAILDQMLAWMDRVRSSR